MEYINRIVERKITKLLTLFPVVAIVGVRQCGKSSLAKYIGHDWNYVDLEDTDDLDRIQSDPKFFFKQYPNKLIIDEAQELPEIFKILRGVIDQNRSLKGRFIVTGSSSIELLKHITESLAGRIAVVELGTFTGREQSKAKPSKLFSFLEDEKKPLQIEDILTLSDPIEEGQVQHAMIHGGYPELSSFQEAEDHKIWMNEYFKSYINRDIRKLFPKLDIIKYRRFVQMLSPLSGQLINKAELARSLDISQTTARDYLDIAHGSFVWRNLFSFHKDPSKSIVKMPRGGFRDSGLLCFLQKISDFDSLFKHPKVGRIFENFVTEEIMKNLNSILTTEVIPYYFQTKGGAEVDLVLDAHFGILPIEIKWGQRVRSNELFSLKQFIERNKCRFGIVINNGESIQMISNQIIQVPIQFI